jgi:DNA-binding XRE family transcriptional regulator
MSGPDFPVQDDAQSDDERLTSALAEAIGSVVERQGSPSRPIELLVTVRGNQVSVSATPAPARLQTFASWLKFRLDEQRLTKVALADRLGVSERTIRRWLAGETEPRFQELLRISSLLGNPPV